MMQNLVMSLPVLAATIGLAQTAPARWAANSPDVDPKWLAVGLAAEGVIAACLLIHLIVSRRRRRFAIPLAIAWFATIATLALLVYAASRHDLVFTLGQFLNVLICLRLLAWIHGRRSGVNARASGSFDKEDSRFPVIAPHHAERRTGPPPSKHE